MKEYLKISCGNNVMYYPEFRRVEVYLVPSFNDSIRINIELETFDGEYSGQQKLELQNQIGCAIKNPFSGVCLRLENGELKSEDLASLKMDLIDGEDEDDGGLVQLCVDWVIYLRNILIEFKMVNKQLYTIWTAESENIDSYNVAGLDTKYELVAKVNKVNKLKDYKELLACGKQVVMRNIRYNEIMLKMKGRKLNNVKLNGINALDRNFEYNDSIWAWNKLEESIEKERLIDPYNKKKLK